MTWMSGRPAAANWSCSCSDQRCRPFSVLTISIGPPAVGKSTALLRSGLRFPFTPGERKAVKGVGGTRNCDWWFSDQAILLDTAGRYTSEDDDLDEWAAFLGMVKKYRRKRPLNGLIVAASIADLLTANPDELEEQATQILRDIKKSLDPDGLMNPGALDGLEGS